MDAYDEGYIDGKDLMIDKVDRLEKEIARLREENAQLLDALDRIANVYAYKEESTTASMMTKMAAIAVHTLEGFGKRYTLRKGDRDNE